MIVRNAHTWLALTPRMLMLSVLVALGVGGVPSVALRAQTSPRVVQLRLEYREALSTLEAAVAAFEVVESRFNQALDELTVAKTFGDENRENRAYAAAQAASPPIRVARARVRETTEAVEEARGRLGDGLEAELDQLYAQEDTVPIAVLADLRVTIVDMENELDEVRGSLADFGVQPAILLQLRIDPTDGPNDILNKADLLERRASRHTATIAEIDGRLAEFRKRQRLQRARRTALASVERFDDSRVPVGPPGGSSSTAPPGVAVSPADATGVPIRPKTIEEEIRGLEEFREDLVALRDQIIERAVQFRVQAGGEV